MLELTLPAMLFIASAMMADKFKSASFGAVMLALSILILRFGLLLREHADVLQTNNSLSVSFSVFTVGFVQALIVMFGSLPLLAWIDENAGSKTHRAVGIALGVALMLAGAWGSPQFESYLFAEWLKETNIR